MSKWIKNKDKELNQQNINILFKCQMTKVKPNKKKIIFIGFSNTEFIKFTDNTYNHIKSYLPYKFNMKIQWVENNLNQKIGFSIIQKSIKSDISYQSQNTIIVLKIKQILSKKINQTNFHESFKAYKRIGKGSFASVYLVQEIDSGMKYAVKAFSKEVAYSQQNGKKSIKNEINIMRQIDHPNLIKMQEVFETDNSLYIIMNYYEGENLLELLKQKGKLDPDQGFTILKGLLEGLNYLHERNIMHRDIKPENILLQNKDKRDPVLVDFGLATYVNQENKLFIRCGTPGYVAPEIANLKEKDVAYDEKCDIFSFGVIMHMVLLGKILFNGSNFNEMLQMNKQCKIRIDNPVYQTMDTEARSVMFKALTFDPKARPSAKDLLNTPYFKKNNVQEAILGLNLGGISENEDDYLEEEDESNVHIPDEQNEDNKIKNEIVNDQLANVQFNKNFIKNKEDKELFKDSKGTFQMNYTEQFSINGQNPQNHLNIGPLQKRQSVGMSIDEIRTPQNRFTQQQLKKNPDYFTPSNFMRIQEEDDELIQESAQLQNQTTKNIVNPNKQGGFSDFMKFKKKD